MISEEGAAIERYLKRALKGEAAWPCRPFGRRVLHFNLVGSTQEEAKALAASGEPAGALVVARAQSQGHGRKGDSWHSAPGGLWLSVVLRPGFGPDRAEKFSLAAAGAIVLSLNEAIKVFPLHRPIFCIKPPNDVMADMGNGACRKVCGIILEGSVIRDRYDWLVLGIGINVNNALPPGLAGCAATLEELAGVPVPRMPLLRRVLIELAAAYKGSNSVNPPPDHQVFQE